jgi:hypothetical protein
MTITAEKPEGRMSIEVKIDTANYIEGDLVHKMFARKMIQDLEEKFENDESEEIKSLITDLGLKYSLATKYTSFIGVDDKSSKESGVTMTRQVRNQVAHGYGGMLAARMMCCMDSTPRAMATLEYCSDEELYEDIQCYVQPLQEMRVITESVQTSTVSLMRCHLSNDSDYEECELDYVEEDKEETAECSESKSKIQNLLMLTSLQIAVGYCKEDQLVGKMIGSNFEMFRKECEDKGIATRVWLTALIIAFIEQNFSDEKDSWELILEKAREWLGGDELIMAAYSCLM